ncbi:MAG: hypothetical protein WC994_07135 [Brumimicrobium sp.]
MKNLVLFLVVVISINTGCRNNSNTSHQINKIEIKLNEIDSINRGDVDLSLAIQYPNSNYLYCTNNMGNADKLQIFRISLNTFKIDKILDIPKGDFFEAYFVDEIDEKIYLFMNEELNSYTFESKLLKNIKIDVGDIGFITNLKPFSFYPYIINEKLYVEFFPNIDGTYANKEFYTHPFQVAVDLNSTKTQFINTKYPAEYKNHCYGFNFIPDRFFTDDNLQIVTFPYNDSAYIYDLHGVHLKTVFFGTNKSHEFQHIPYTEIDKLQQEVFDNFNSDMPFYGFSTFIPNQNILVRQYFDFNKEEERLDNTIILYDNEWNYIGETMLNKNLSLFGSIKHGLLHLKAKDDKIKIYSVKYR